MTKPIRLSIVIPCFNEEKTLAKCLEKVIDIEEPDLELEILIVDDCSTDGSLLLAKRLEKQYSQVRVLNHSINQGKGASLRTGFKQVTGDFVAIQDADLEYRPKDLKSLLTPLINDDADVVFGTRYLSYGAHRVLYFWHSVGNKFLTLLSNMFTDLNLSDMETCYKVFRKDVLDKIEIEENRFGFEPEIVAKVAQQKVRIYEMGISYFGRTYEEGKKIGAKDGLRALYCIVRYNAFNAPLAMQFLVYLFIGGFAAGINLLLFLAMFALSTSVALSTLSAFFAAAVVNYYLCVKVLFRQQVKWQFGTEILFYTLLVACVAGIDFLLTSFFLSAGSTPVFAKIVATAAGVVLNFLGRRFIIFPEQRRAPWKAQVQHDSTSAMVESTDSRHVTLPKRKNAA